MNTLRYIILVATGFVVYKLPWFTLTDFEGNTLGLTLNGKGDGTSEVWVPEGFEDLGGFSYGYVLIVLLGIGLLVSHSSGPAAEEETSWGFAFGGIIIGIAALVSLALKNTIIGASPDDLRIDGYTAMDFSLAAGFWVVLGLAVLMVTVGVTGAVLAGDSDTATVDNDNDADQVETPSPTTPNPFQ